MIQPKNYHSAKLAAFQSAVNEVFAEARTGGHGLRADDLVVQTANRILDAHQLGKRVETRPGCLGRILGFFKKHGGVYEVCAQLAFELAMAKIENDPRAVKYPDVPLLSDPDHQNGFIKLGTSDEIYNHGFTLLKLCDTVSGKESKVFYYQMPGDGSSRESSLLYSETL